MDAAMDRTMTLRGVEKVDLAVREAVASCFVFNGYLWQVGQSVIIEPRRHGEHGVFMGISVFSVRQGPSGALSSWCSLKQG
jgi:hypothetical protein